MAKQKQKKIAPLASPPAVHCAHVCMRPIESVKPNTRNPNRHPKRQIELLAKIIATQGWRAPITVSKRSGLVVRGHGRLEAAQLLGLTSVPVDEQDYASDADELSDLLADNKIAELAMIDTDAFDAILKDLATTPDFDWEMCGLDSVMEKPRADVEPRHEIAESLQVKYGTQLGDIWNIGRHTLILDDSTQNDHRSEHATTLIFDPEWDSIPSTISGFESVLAFCDCATIGTITSIYGAPSWLFVWDCVSSWYTPNRPLKRVKLCAWYGDITRYNCDGFHYGDAGKARIAKNTRGKYLYNPDPRGKHLSDLYPEPITKTHSEETHVHAKPLDWMTMLIANCTTAGDVYDPFVGSGTSIMACERLGRMCIGVEMNPSCAAVALERISQYTGCVPVRTNEKQ